MLFFSSADSFSFVSWADTSEEAGADRVLLQKHGHLPDTASLEYLRDIFDRNDIDRILIGMPGTEKRMYHYPQLFSRVCFAHHYRPLLGGEL